MYTAYIFNIYIFHALLVFIVIFLLICPLSYNRERQCFILLHLHFRSCSLKLFRSLILSLSLSLCSSCVHLRCYSQHKSYSCTLNTKVSLCAYYLSYFYYKNIFKYYVYYILKIIF